ncbi:hypothetical protein EA187_08050 [Lujinxingia sediminis]|uniref:Receptor L-domain domain-containing protein n=1 Tax=Lujinxingia sediminis TaxID=2480984 RepID=A0ABY0CTQ6_9DELT|nr:hypothetical protein [Lujinxingia sediminis]RVU45709.1 hypothetical protein EA187_08050 [Lujinxingia sediminis]
MGWKRQLILITALMNVGSGCGEPDLQGVPQACGLETSQECNLSEDSWIKIETADDLEAYCEDACEQVYRLYFYDLREVAELTGFSWLKRVEGNLNISGLRSVHTLQGFDNLEYSNSIIIENNFSLNAIDAFGSLREVNHLKLSSMDGIDSIQAFDHLEYLGPADDLGDDNLGFFLDGMNGITHLEGLHKVREAGFVVIRYNKNLESIDIMESVEEVRSLAIVHNPKVASLGEWPNLRRVHQGIQIEGAPNLRRCEVEALIDQLEERPPTVELSGLSDAPCD